MGELFCRIIRVIKLLQIKNVFFFHNKIDISMGLPAIVDEPLLKISDQTFNGVPLNCFSGVTHSKYVIPFKGPSQFYELDPLPSWLL